MRSALAMALLPLFFAVIRGLSERVGGRSRGPAAARVPEGA
jgi:hypothetical protein